MCHQPRNNENIHFFIHNNMAVYNNKLEMLLRVEQQQKQVDDNKQSDENLLILE